jgi:hypothetical protein
MRNNPKPKTAIIILSLFNKMNHYNILLSFLRIFIFFFKLKNIISFTFRFFLSIDENQQRVALSLSIHLVSSLQKKNRINIICPTCIRAKKINYSQSTSSFTSLNNTIKIRTNLIFYSRH